MGDDPDVKDTLARADILKMGRSMRRVMLGVLFVVFVNSVFAASASAYPFDRTLRRGVKGPDVRALQLRVAGWYGKSDQTPLGLDGHFVPATATAVRAFQKLYGLSPDGIAGPATFAVLDGLEDTNGSTLHFDWAEFTQNRNGSCPARANAYAGSFRGGMVSPQRARNNIKKLMWRLEALRAKGGNKAIGINSGFRSVSYNDCIGGARASQHMYGTAVDNRMAGTDNRTERKLAMRSQFSGIGCYSSLSHNHFDIRMDNHAYPESRHFWWPERDDHGRHLAEDGRPCWGEGSRSGARTASVNGAGSAPLLPTERVLELFEGAGEVFLNGAD